MPWDPIALADNRHLVIIKFHDREVEHLLHGLEVFARQVFPAHGGFHGDLPDAVAANLRDAPAGPESAGNVAPERTHVGTLAAHALDIERRKFLAGAAFG